MKLNPMMQEIFDYFETYKIQKGKIIGIVLANYKSTTGFLQTVIIKHGKKLEKRHTKRFIDYFARGI